MGKLSALAGNFTLNVEREFFLLYDDVYRGWQRTTIKGFQPIS